MFLRWAFWICFVSLILFLAFVLFAPSVFAEEYRLEPLFHDPNPCDGVNDPGSRVNPYVLRDSYGREVGRITVPCHSRDCPRQLSKFPWKKNPE